MPVVRALKLIRKAREEDRRERYYRLWLVRYPSYTEKNFETFEEFYEKIFPPKVELDMRSKDELMAEILGGEDL